MAIKMMQAIKIVKGKRAEAKSAPLPRLRDDYVLTRVKCVALNPTDWKHIDGAGAPGSTVGCDFSGVIEEVGPAVTKNWKKGDRIAAFAHGGNSTEMDDGCFAEYCVVKGDLGIKIPKTMSDTEACTLGLGLTTVGQGLYQSLELPLPGSGVYDDYFLVYGGSTATGTLAIQFAKLSGCKVITTCSARNARLVEDQGAEAVFDYSDPDCANKIREYTQDRLTRAFDTISEGNSTQICEDAISSQGGVVSHLLPVKHSRSDVVNKHTLGYTVMGEAFAIGDNMMVPAKSEDFEFGKVFSKLCTKLLAKQSVVPHPHRVGTGWSGVLDGLDELRDGKVSGMKLVYRIAE